MPEPLAPEAAHPLGLRGIRQALVLECERAPIVSLGLEPGVDDVHEQVERENVHGSKRRQIADDLEKVYHYFPRLRERRTSQAGYTSGGEQQMTAIGRALMSRPSTILLDEPSMGLAPQLVEEIFEIVKNLNVQEKVSILLAEQNTNVALRFAHYGYILENGRVVLDGDAAQLRENEDVKEFYLGIGGEGRRSFRDVKHYRRRKRWR